MGGGRSPHMGRQFIDYKSIQILLKDSSFADRARTRTDPCIPHSGTLLALPKPGGLCAEAEIKTTGGSNGSKLSGPAQFLLSISETDPGSN